MQDLIMGLQAKWAASHYMNTEMPNIDTEVHGTGIKEN